MRTTIPRFFLALGLAGTLALAGCGSDDGDDSSSPSDTSSSSTETSSETSATPPAETATAAESEPPADEGGEGDKPSREDVIAGYEKVITAGTSSEPDEFTTKAATCLVDELYDTASVQTLQALADGDVSKIDPDDASLFGDAGVVCAKAGS